MDSFEPSAFGPLGGLLTLAVRLVLRELTSGVLKEARKKLWGSRKDDDHEERLGINAQTVRVQTGWIMCENAGSR